MFKVYEMRRGTDDIPASAISPVPLDAGRIAAYKRSYNAAFRPMREALGIVPFDWYPDDGELPDRAEDIYVLTDGEELIGSVACYGNEIDDLFVSETHLRRGYGRELLMWAMDCIRSRGYDEIVLHVAAWNEGAVRMYRREGFVITKSEIILKEQDDMIHRIDRSDIPECVRVIRDSFMTVAEDLGLTPENAPRFTAFATTEERLYHQLDAEDRYMAAYYLDDGSIAGYYSLLMQEGGICELNNLCVLPEHRHKDIGAALLTDAVRYAVERGCSRMDIGIVEENTVLRRWYEEHGFVHIGTKKFDFFPFTCGYMEREITT